MLYMDAPSKWVGNGLVHLGPDENAIGFPFQFLHTHGLVLL